MLFDGICALCSGSALFVVRHSRDVSVCTMQSVPGQEMLQRLGLPLDGFDTFAFYEDRRVWEKSDAVIRLARHLDWPWRIASVIRVLPRHWRDALYDRIARNRYQIFGKRDTCLIPTAEQRGRVIG